jgi:Concanavalin A-like lectin/glucanases superfamily
VFARKACEGSINGQAWKTFDAGSITLPYEQTPDRAVIQICLGGAAARPFEAPKSDDTLPPVPSSVPVWKTKNFPAVATNSPPLRIGADSEGQNRFRGEMADPQIYSRALSAGAIGRLVQGTSDDLDTDPALVGRWSFEKQQESVVPSVVIGGLSAKIVGQAKMADGPRGKAIQLAGEGFLETANDLYLAVTRSEAVQP